jgi:RimJ/RimL family protein N-acetyltransferase
MLKLVPLSARHARDLATLAGDDADPPWATIPWRSSLQNVLAFVARAQRRRARGEGETFAVCDAERLLGIAMLARDPAAPERAELGYWIGSPDRGHGYATAAARQLLTHGFGRMQLALVFAHCPDSNRQSTRVLAKLGFRPVGVEASKATAGFVHRYELTSYDWP